MANVSAGLALSGKKVFMYAIAPFVTCRCYEMLKVNLSLMSLPVTAVGVGAGFSYDDSGPTHHATEDLAIMRALPKMTILNASDSVMAGRFADLACEVRGPSYVRLDRQLLPAIYHDKGPDTFTAGLAALRAGKDLFIISTGNMVHHAIQIAARLAEYSIDAGVIDVYRLKPINEELLLSVIGPTRRIVALEEHLLVGGLGSAVAEIVCDYGESIRLRRFGVRDEHLYAYGGRGNIQRRCGLDVDSVLKAIVDWF
jgi:transketolase